MQDYLEEQKKIFFGIGFGMTYAIKNDNRINIFITDSEGENVFCGVSSVDAEFIKNYIERKLVLLGT